MSSRRKKWCPLRFVPERESFIPCVDENCAWWTGEACAIVALARASVRDQIRERGRTLEQLGPCAMCGREAWGLDPRGWQDSPDGVGPFVTCAVCGFSMSRYSPELPQSPHWEDDDEFNDWIAKLRARRQQQKEPPADD